MPRSPFTTTLIQSTLLNALSNFLAQWVDQYQNSKPLTINLLALLQFTIYGIIIVPINFEWQRYLEARFPGFPRWRDIFTRSSTFPASNFTLNLSNIAKYDRSESISKAPGARSRRDTITDDDLLPRKEKSARQLPQQSTSMSGLRSFAVKFFLDQTVGGVLNIVLFVVLINALKGVGLGQILGLVTEDFWPIFIARLKYRPVVSTLLYTVVPVDRRVVFGSACGVIWGVYLSLYAAV